MSVKIEFHRVNANGTDSLSGKEGRVYVVTFEDGTVTEGELNVKSLTQLLDMKLGRKPERKAAIPPNGEAE